MTSEPDSSPRRRPPTIDLTATEVDATPAPAAAAPDQSGDGGAESAHAESQSSLPPDPPPVRRQASLFGMAAACAVASAIGVLAALWLTSGFVSHPPAAVPNSAPPANDAAITKLSARLTAVEGAIATRQPDQALASRLAAADVAAKAQAETVAALSRRVDDLATTAQNALAQANAAASRAEKAAGSATDAAKSSAQAAANHGDMDALAGRVTNLEATLKTLSGAIAQQNTEQGDIAALGSRVGTLEAAVKTFADSAAQQSTARADLQALTGRVAALEGTVKTLSGQVARQSASADDRAARLAVAAEALRAVVERGAPYQAELAAAQGLGADAKATATLAPFAATGVTSSAALGRELAALAPALQRAAAPVSDESSLWSRLQANAQQLVHVTPTEAAPGSDPPAVAARVGLDATHDDVAAALADIGKLPEGDRAVVAGWVQKAQARQAAIAAARSIAAAALAALAKPASQ